jgi:hypothetical protein
VAWWLVFFFPCGMGCGLLRAIWPDGLGFGWESLALDGGCALLVPFVLGNLIAFLSRPAEGPPTAPKLPEVGPRWSERQGKSTTNAVQPPSGMTEADEPDQ